MPEDDIASAPITIKLLDTSHLYQEMYPQIMIEPSPCHYPQFINSPVEKQPLCTTQSDDKWPPSSPCILSKFFCCCT